MDPSCDNSIPSLPLGCKLTYLDEGAANVVYEIDVRPSTPLSSEIETYEDGTPPPTELEFERTPTSVFENKLLRLRKALPTTIKCAQAQRSWEQYIKPLFNPSEIVNQSLVRLSPNIIEELNSDLRVWEETGRIGAFTNSRLSKRVGTYIAKDGFGLLVTDMTPGKYFVEFKPKWLVQSPSAPPNARRCRTCALAARTKARGKPDEPLKSPVCPLDFLSSNPADLKRAAQLLPESVQPSIHRFVAWLQVTNLLKKLRDIQGEMDHTGVLKSEPDDIKLLVAMTLRDCTVFVRFPDNPEHDDWAIEARLGDLDLKSQGKHGYWRSVERSLIDEGWYEGNEPSELSQPLTCALSR